MTRNTFYGSLLKIFLITTLLLVPFSNHFANPTFKRIISLAPNVTEILFALGRGNSVVGITDYCNYPAPQVQKISRIGSLQSPSLEKITALKPDLIILTDAGNSLDTYTALKKLAHKMGAKIHPVRIRSLEDIESNIIALGTLLNRKKVASQLAKELKVTRTNIHKHSVRNPKKGNKIKLLWVYSTQPLIVAGQNSFVDEMITLSGATNLGRIGKGRYPRLTLESVVAANPDMIIHSSADKDTASFTKFWSPYRTVAAVAKKAIYTVHPDIADRPGPRISIALKQVERMVQKATQSSPSSQR